MFYTYIKRTIDIIGSLVLIILFLPVWIIVPILIKLDSQGSVFFRQKRVGQNGQPFLIIKFRTMIESADDYWKAHPALYEKFKKKSWKLTLDEDPRITKLGKALRQTSIDEFPQVFNILFGQMSLIGPRPIRDIELNDAVKRYGSSIQKDINLALTAKPGLSGIWQVSGRNDVPWDRRIRLDAKYAANRNLVDDLKIMIKTPLAMVSKW
jgi:lipopolysaccharide/colanic/teichoic acid biosynthesis glycosyltransferase